MKRLRKADDDKSLLLRTDFSDNAAWDALCVALRAPSEEGFMAKLECLSDSAYSGLTIQQLLVLKPKESGHYFVLIADAECLANPERPVLVVDLNEEPGRSFRVIPSEVWGVENNLRISNMDFFEFADNADPDGVFRGFRQE